MKVPRLRYLREGCGLTQRELAELAGVARRSIAGWELGESIRPGSARKVAAALGVEIAELYEESASRAFGPSSEVEHTEQFLVLLRGYEEMAERGEELDWTVEDFSQVRHLLSAVAIPAAARALDRDDRDAIANILGRTMTVLSWLKWQHERAVEQAKGEVAALAEPESALEELLNRLAAA